MRKLLLLSLAAVSSFVYAIPDQKPKRRRVVSEGSMDEDYFMALTKRVTDGDQNALKTLGMHYANLNDYHRLCICISYASRYNDDATVKSIVDAILPFTPNRKNFLLTFTEQLNKEDREAKYIAGLFYYYGILFEQNDEKAISAFQEVAYPHAKMVNGKETTTCVMHPGAVFMLAKIIKPSNPEKADVYFEIARNDGFRPIE